MNERDKVSTRNNYDTPKFNSMIPGMRKKNSFEDVRF